MKKVSTAAQQQSRSFSEHKFTIGLDLGDRSSCYCVLDETGRIVMEQKSFHHAQGSASGIRSDVAQPDRFGDGMHSPWVSRVLSGLGHEGIVAHARNVRDRRKEARR